MAYIERALKTRSKPQCEVQFRENLRTRSLRKDRISKQLFECFSFLKKIVRYLAPNWLYGLFRKVHSS